jgi:hypothetical protein
MALKDHAEQLLVNLIEAATKAGEFIKDQIPIVIKELLLFHTIAKGLAVFFGLLAFLLNVWLLMVIRNRAAKYVEEHPNKYDAADKYLWCIVPSIGMAISTIVFFVNLYRFLEITLAPRVWLLEYAAQLMR